MVDVCKKVGEWKKMKSLHLIVSGKRLNLVIQMR